MLDSDNGLENTYTPQHLMQKIVLAKWYARKNKIKRHLTLYLAQIILPGSSASRRKMHERRAHWKFCWNRIVRQNRRRRKSERKDEQDVKSKMRGNEVER